MEPWLRADSRFLFDQHRVWVMGILNVTPDSFFPQGRFASIPAALGQAETFIREGADALDVGGESTRPGAEVVSLEQEIGRVIPVIAALHHTHPEIPLSIDTQKATVAREALHAGASILNDVSAFRTDPEMVAVAAESQAPVILMHRQGTPKTMQDAPHYENVVEDVLAFFHERIAFATKQGVREENIILDPGMGFGKTVEHNVKLLQNIEKLKTVGRPLLIGLSRKSFLGRLASADPQSALPVEERLEASLTADLWAAAHGANGLRVHDVQATVRSLRVWKSLCQGVSS